MMNFAFFSQNLEDIKGRLASYEGLAILELHGDQCPDKPTLMNKFQEVFGFPSHFGKNWDALVDCMRDYLWEASAPTVLVVTASDELLKDEPGSRDVFLEVLNHCTQIPAENQIRFVFLDSDLEHSELCKSARQLGLL